MQGVGTPAYSPTRSRGALTLGILTGLGILEKMAELPIPPTESVQGLFSSVRVRGVVRNSTLSGKTGVSAYPFEVWIKIILESALIVLPRFTPTRALQEVQQLVRQLPAPGFCVARPDRWFSEAPVKIREIHL
jgi:hypothetical protein